VDPSPPERRTEAGPPAPYIPASTVLPEITIKALVLGVLLSMILAGANAYLGLFAGMTVSASIPAAVISMAVLRLFRRQNILENNIVQTAASAGESLAAGVIFTIPALVLMGYWDGFSYWQTTIIAGLGGVLGVLFTIPLRRILIVREKLAFPEGVATAEVLKSGEKGGQGVLLLALGGAIGAVFKLCQAGFHLWAETLELARSVGRSLVYGGTSVSPALMAVGYIVGMNIAVLVFLGGALNWLVAIPIVAAGMDWPVYQAAGAEALGGVPDWAVVTAEGQGAAQLDCERVDAVDGAGTLWSNQTRYIGVGAMVIGGLWALISLAGPIGRGIRQGLRSYARAAGGTMEEVPRTERDTSMKWVFIGVGALIVPIFALYLSIVKSVPITAFMAVAMVLAGFLFSAVAGYMAGLVGSSNNPISGVTIATILSSALMLSVLLGTQSDPAAAASAVLGPAAAILIGAVVCCAAAIAGDNMQDLKAGHLLGATPRKQQFMQIVGTLSAAVVLAPVLMLIQKAYGIGVPTAEHPNPLTAPQATLMESVARGVFQGNLPWTMISIGVGVGAAIIALDQWLKWHGARFRTPILAVAVGIYLPFELSVPIFAGGLIAHLTGRRLALWRRGPEDDEGVATAKRNGLLLAAGLITGEALVGIFMAIPIVIAQDRNVLALLDEPFGGWPGVEMLVGVGILLYLVVTTSFRRAARRP